MLILDWQDFASFEMELIQTHYWVSYLCILRILYSCLSTAIAYIVTGRQKIPYLGWHCNFLSQPCHGVENHCTLTWFNNCRGFGLFNATRSKSSCIRLGFLLIMLTNLSDFIKWIFYQMPSLWSLFYHSNSSGWAY